jgi:hypothetical protein
MGRELIQGQSQRTTRVDSLDYAMAGIICLAIVYALWELLRK